MHIVIKSKRLTWAYIESPNTLSTTLRVNPAWAFWVKNQNYIVIFRRCAQIPITIIPKGWPQFPHEIRKKFIYSFTKLANCKLELKN